VIVRELPLVSMIVTTYNYGRFVTDAVDSALSQTYENIEVIVVDDGSSDDTNEVVTKYGDLVDYYFKVNGGISSARNYGAKRAKGDYIVFLDSDDKLDQTFVEKTYELLLEESADVGYVYTQLRCFDASDEVTEFRGYSAHHLKNSNYIPSGCLVKSELARRFHYDEELAVLEDWDFYLTLAENGFIGVLLNEPLYFYRKHFDKGSTLDRTSQRRYLRVRHLIMVKHRTFYGIRSTTWHWSLYLAHEAIFTCQQGLTKVWASLRSSTQSSAAQTKR
jgi:glycosyltransferase involved in cell wall biosynthesis